MEENSQHIIQLLYASVSKEPLEPAQASELQHWLAEDARHQELYDRLQRGDKLPDYLAYRLNTQAIEKAYEQFVKQLPADANFEETVSAKTVHRIHFLRRWGWAAAVIILLSGLGLYYFNIQSYKSQKSPQITVQTTDIAPGSNKAIWTLSDGKQIELDSTVLDMTRKSLANIGYNELRTPPGGQYQLILPDGSKVWLNAASSIKYPVAFSDKERSVDVTGETYFEIEKDANKPFKVYSNGQEIEVLGTSFNVNVYDNEPVKKTTLVSGSIKVSVNNQTAILKPGQQASIPIISITQIKQITVQTTNLEQDLAWKNGLFNFQNKSLKEVMRQLARWYDLEIIYEGQIPDIEFIGELSRNVKLSELLKGLQGMGIHFKQEGKKLIVYP